MRPFITVVTLLTAGLTTPVLAANAERGAKLHQEQCTACHASRFGDNGNAIYTRANRRVQSLGGLKMQVNRCKNNLRIVWFDEDVDDVVAHLNASYYKFDSE